MHGEFGRKLDFDESVLGAEPLDDAKSCRGLGARDPVAVLATGDEAMEIVGDEEIAIDERDRVVGQLEPQIFPQCRLAGAVVGVDQRRHHVCACRHQRDQPYGRIGAAAARRRSVLPAKGCPILARVGHSERAAIDGVDRQPAPPVGIVLRLAPHRRRHSKQMLQRRRADARPSLRDRTPRHAAAVLHWHRQVEPRHDALDRVVAQERHADDQPHNLLGWQAAPAQGRRARRQKRLLDPCRREVLAKARQLVRYKYLGDQSQFFVELHGDLLGEIAAS